MQCIQRQSGCAGASEEAIAMADQAVTIPMSPSFVDSFNVSGMSKLAICALTEYHST